MLKVCSIEQMLKVCQSAAANIFVGTVAVALDIATLVVGAHVLDRTVILLVRLPLVEVWDGTKQRRKVTPIDNSHNRSMRSGRIQVPIGRQE